ncbi:Ureidoglycolate lyase [Variovorax boronicumulans]|uniref:fumarylacetoacetate hydrolase family protein n=1 Tax=Variovorax boronicumulans TaxID=436515 RepID=UPI000BB300C3|nr:fumarylacetoacetate hydrolase family protein [Variovorax boronicumulans]PBI89326.1 Ureidoglycolate lyase [Variovorax boronicumulans]
MKLLTFQNSDGQFRLGALHADGVLDLARHLPSLPADLRTVIAQWQRWEALLRSCLVERKSPDIELQSVRLCAPIPQPGKLLGTGMNYADHIAETGAPTPTDQVWFSMPSTAINGPFDPIQRPRVSEALDYEAELVMVIGQRCRHVPIERAREVIFGYCVGNDVSVRDWQLRTSQVFLGKSFDTHAPFGPWLTTADEIEDPHDLSIRCVVNGETRQNSNTRNMIFNCFAQIAHLSQVMTLEPGDVIFTGTPAGVGLGYRPPRYLRNGDVVRIEIEKLGAIEAKILDEATS